MLDEILSDHPHARAVLLPALPPHGSASHAYLFHGPPGCGKRGTARELAAALLTDGSPDPAGAGARVRSGAHPDLTWVTPSGAGQLLISDIDEPVVAAASRTPFEAKRRVFVIERADTMNDQAANRMLKTLEEPASYVHLILLADTLANVMPTIASRCQIVRFEAPSVEALAARLQSGHGIDPQTAKACARLSLGDAERALALALGDGMQLRGAAETYARAVLTGKLTQAPWEALLAQARAEGQRAGSELEELVAAESEALPDRERKRAKREGEVAAKRVSRRAQSHTLDHGLRLVSLWLRDVACAADGAPELARNADRLEQVQADVVHAPAERLREAALAVEDARTTLKLNPTEDLLLEALASRLSRSLMR